MVPCIQKSVSRTNVLGDDERLLYWSPWQYQPINTFTTKIDITYDLSLSDNDRVDRLKSSYSNNTVIKRMVEFSLEYRIQLSLAKE